MARPKRSSGPSLSLIPHTLPRSPLSISSFSSLSPNRGLSIFVSLSFPFLAIFFSPFPRHFRIPVPYAAEEASFVARDRRLVNTGKEPGTVCLCCSTPSTGLCHRAVPWEAISAARADSHGAPSKIVRFDGS